ncbi:oligoribonuclease, mitochondrial-like [Halichondria panicea]|uniref:oligoribonuclease, mitochondrial-like n=1 Tax=Halichondria panicea TaxID=6063 RepID=UPI00312BA8D6
MACIVTDTNLNIVAEGPEVKIHQPDSILNGMGPWCTEHHGNSGLTAACRSSTTSLVQAEEAMLSFVQGHTPKSVCPLAGNTVHMDKRFLDKYMPRFSGHLHYRIIDVSSVKELSKRWYPSEYRKSPFKRGAHRALEDIKESIEELKYYKSTVFK